MCGIMSYIGKRNSLPILLGGLRREIYRGYDSSGIVVFDGKEMICVKEVGKLDNLENKLANQSINGFCGLGHVRWSTHGLVTEVNAHPHWDCSENVFLVHNGIIENYQTLKEKLIQKGHRFVSETDTEVLPHLIEHFFQGNLEEAVNKALRFVKGTYALAIISTKDPGKLVLARNSAPLLIGIGENEFFAASDPSAVIAHTKKVIYLDDGEIAVLTPSQFFIQDINQKGEVPVIVNSTFIQMIPIKQLCGQT